MIRSGKQMAKGVGWGFAQQAQSHSQKASLPAAALLPPLVRAQMSAVRRVPGGGSIALGKSFQSSPLSVLARVTTSAAIDKTRMGGINGGNKKQMPLPFRAEDLRRLDNMGMTRVMSTGPFSGPFSGDAGSKSGVPPTGSESSSTVDKFDARKRKNGETTKLLPKDPPALKNRFMEPPEDGLTRYPTFRSPQGVLRGLDYMGTTVFALSGTVTAGTVGMDLLGCMIVGTITATGGGTVRDLLVGNNPVFWMHETEYLWMCLITSFVVFFIWTYLAERGFRDDMEVLNWADAMGVGAFCCIGAQAGVRKGLSKIVCICCGMLTSTFGGVIRDVLCSRPPRILFSHAEIYASTALFGSTVYIASKAAGLPPVARITAGFLAGGGLRVLAFKTDIRLPSWTQQSEELNQQRIEAEQNVESKGAFDG